MARPLKHLIDLHYFDSVNSQQKAYILGLLYADGGRSGYQVVLSLEARDQGLLEHIRQCLAMSCPLRPLQGGKYLRLDIGGQHLVRRLEELGIVAAKTWKIRFPTWLANELQRHFFRGYFDGDGCLTVTRTLNKATFSIVSNPQFCKDLAEVLWSHLGITARPYAIKHCPSSFSKAPTLARALRISGNRQVLRILNWLYEDATIYLDRKYMKYQSLAANPVSLKRRPLLGVAGDSDTRPG